MKLIFIRRQDIAAIQARIRDGGAPLSRWESRFIRTQKDDINKYVYSLTLPPYVTDIRLRVIPFLFIALLLEEVIPLIAIYAPFMLPSTCILPSQRARIEEKKADKAVAYAAHYRSLFAQLEQSQNPAGHLSLRALRGGDGPLAVCGYDLFFFFFFFFSEASNVLQTSEAHDYWFRCTPPEKNTESLRLYLLR